MVGQGTEGGAVTAIDDLIDPLDEQAQANEEEPREVEGEGAFTRLVRALAPGCEIAPALLEEVERKLERALVRELRRRRLWHSHPSFLGVVGWPHWYDREPGRGGPLAELVEDAATFIFVQRMGSLKAQLLTKPNIEGLVFTAVYQFVQHRQLTHDRLGSDVFELLRSAVRQAVAAGELRVVSGEPRIGNATLLALAASTVAVEVAGPERLASVVESWGGALASSLITAVGEDKGRLVADLARRLSELDELGVHAFRFGDLIHPLKADLRARLAALYGLERGETGLAEEQGGLARVCRDLQPDVEQRLAAEDRFRKLIDCMAASIDVHQGPERTRHYLRRMLVFLRAFAAEQVRIGRRDGLLPSLRKLAALAGVPRERLSEMLGTLGEFLRHCRQELDGEVAAVLAASRARQEAAP